MPQIFEYDYWPFTLEITLATQRPDEAPSGILVAAPLQDQYAGRVRNVLREYRLEPNAPGTIATYFTAYRLTQLKPAGSTRAVQDNYDLIRLQYSGALTMTNASQIGDPEIVFSLERTLAKGVKDIFEANQLPNDFIPGQMGTVGDSYIGIVATVGEPTNIGQWQIP